MRVYKKIVSLCLLLAVIAGALPGVASAKSIAGLTILKKPDKTVYNLGQKFNAKGMRVALYYDDKSTKELTKYTVKGYNANQPNICEIKVGYDRYTSENSFGVIVRDLATPKLKKVTSKKKKTATVTWKKTAGAKGYIIYRKKGKAKSWTKIKKIKKATTLTFTNKKLSKAKYSFTVQAYRGKILSGYNTKGKSVKVK